MGGGEGWRGEVMVRTGSCLGQVGRVGGGERRRGEAAKVGECQILRHPQDVLSSR